VAASDDLQRLGLQVGRVVEAREHPGARGPSFVLTVDLGSERREATVALPGLSGDELVGRQVVCATAEDELLVLAAQSHARGPVLLRPDDEVEDGSAVG
jgi:tRNA-binding EMAP/Myf-like protein